MMRKRYIHRYAVVLRVLVHIHPKLLQVRGRASMHSPRGLIRLHMFLCPEKRYVPCEIVFYLLQFSIR